MDEADDVGILLDSSRFTEVGQLRTLVVVVAVFHLTAQLRQGNDWNVQLLGQLLERTGNHTYFLLAAAKLHAAGVHQLEVVDNDDFHVVFPHEAAGFRTELEDGKARGIVDIKRCAVELAHP